MDSSHASSLHSTRAFLARASCSADDASYTISERLEPLLNPCAPGAHDLYRRFCSLCNLRTPRASTRSAWSWCALLMPPMLQLLHSPHASRLHPTRMHMAYTACITDGAACAISVRLEPLLDSRGPGAHYLCHRCYSLWTLRTPRAFTRPVCSLRALHVPPMMQLVQSSNALNPYSTRVLLACTTCNSDDAACAISERLRPLFYPGSPCRHELSGRCYSLCRLRRPQTFNRPGFFLQARTVSPMLQHVQYPNALGLDLIQVPWQARTVPPMLQLVQ